MPVLPHDEIVRRIQNGQLIRGAQEIDGSPVVEPDSYDLRAGIAVWKEGKGSLRTGEVLTARYKPDVATVDQASITVQPGQMLFVITEEEVMLPDDLCGTVYSRNALARSGILALNAGHVDPGYVGPIIIRLINLRATPWTLVMGEQIFTIVFETLEVGPDTELVGHARLTKENALANVRESAGAALSNALYDLYEAEVEKRLLQHSASVEERLRAGFRKDFVSKDEVQLLILGTIAKGLIGLVLFGAAVGGAIAGFIALR